MNGRTFSPSPRQRAKRDHPSHPQSHHTSRRHPTPLSPETGVALARCHQEFRSLFSTRTTIDWPFSSPVCEVARWQLAVSLRCHCCRGVTSETASIQTSQFQTPYRQGRKKARQLAISSDKNDDSEKLVSWCFEPSQPQRTTLTTTTTTKQQHSYYCYWWWWWWWWLWWSILSCAISPSEHIARYKKRQNTGAARTRRQSKKSKCNSNCKQGMTQKRSVAGTLLLQFV